MGYHAYEPFLTDLSTANTMKLKPRKLASGDDTIIYANTVDARPTITLYGNGGIETDSVCAGIQIKDGGNNVLKLYYPGVGTDCIIYNSVNNFDTYLETRGTGVLKFGTHAALGGEALSGYITIKDAGGTTRKLGVIS